KNFLYDGENLLSRSNTMSSNATIRPQQIEQAKKLLQNLPEKENRKTRPEAAELLERDFKKAKEKGYNSRELSQMLKNEGIIIPAYLIKRFFAENGNISVTQKQEAISAKKQTSQKAAFIVPDTSDKKI
ncbi:hypothetical protein, partial [Desulfovibrio sp. SGI.169]